MSNLSDYSKLIEPTNTEAIQHAFPVVEPITSPVGDVSLVTSILNWKEKKLKLSQFKIINEETGKLIFNECPIATIKQDGKQKIIDSFYLPEMNLAIARRLASLNIPLNGRRWYTHFLGPVPMRHVSFMKDVNSGGIFRFVNKKELSWTGTEVSLKILVATVYKNSYNYCDGWYSQEKITSMLKEAIELGVSRTYSTYKNLTVRTLYKFEPVDEKQLTLFPEILV